MDLSFPLRQSNPLSTYLIDNNGDHKLNPSDMNSTKDSYVDEKELEEKEFEHSSLQETLDGELKELDKGRQEKRVSAFKYRNKKLTSTFEAKAEK